MIAKALSLQLLILSVVIFPHVLSPAVAQEEKTLTVKTNSDEYDLGDTVRISGNVGKYIPQVALAIKWIKPDKKTIGDQVTPLSDGSYAASLRLQSSGENVITGGRWRVEVTFDNRTANDTFVVKDSYIEVQIVHEDEEEDDIFVSGEKVNIEGKVIRKDGDNDKVTITIINSNGISFSSSQVKFDNREFDYSFTLDGSRVSYGQWFIDVKYVEGHRTAMPFDVVPSPVSVTTNKGGYLPGDTAMISGAVNASVIDSKKSITLTITSSDDQLFNTTSVNLNANGSFAYQLQLFGWSATKYGDWKVIAKYGIHKGATSFEVREPNSLITAKVNKQSFQVGETITVSGRTAALGSDVSVHFYIAGSRILYKFAPTPVSDDYTYSYELIPDKGLVPGSYEVLVTHNGKEASTSFLVKAPVTDDDEPRHDPLGLFALKPKSSNGTVLSSISTGQQIVLSTTLANENDEDIFFTGLIEIRNSQGVTQYLGSQNGMVVKKGFTAFGMEWMPDLPGTYQARIFLLTSLTDPEILSPLVTSELVISAS